MKILLDTNVILDVLLPRPEWLEAAEGIWKATESKRLQTYVTANSLTDIYYVARKLSGATKALEAVDVCLSTFDIAAVDRATLERARQSPGQDFEDNLQLACSERLGLTAIVTREPSGFQDTALAVWSPSECLRRLGS